MSWDAEDVEALQAELESYHAALFEAQKDAQKARAELEQARKERDELRDAEGGGRTSTRDAGTSAQAPLLVEVAQRYRDALERITLDDTDAAQIACDALAGDQENTT